MSINKENTFWKQKKSFEELSPFSLLDFAGTPSAILWFSGCNMQCQFCYNPELVYGKGKFSFKDFEGFFKSRQNLLKGVVFCGGEPTVCSGLEDIAKELKLLGFKIKLDTNGLNPKVVEKLLAKGLVDFIALDFKATKEKFTTITKASLKLYDEFLKTVKLLVNSQIDYEIRTTFHKDLLNNNDLINMMDMLQSFGYSKSYYIQNFIDSKDTIGGLVGVNGSEALELKSLSQNYSFDIVFRNFN